MTKPKELAICVWQHRCSPGTENRLFEDSKQLSLKRFPPFLASTISAGSLCQGKRNKGLDLQRSLQEHGIFEVCWGDNTSLYHFLYFTKLSGRQAVGSSESSHKALGSWRLRARTHWWTQSRYIINACWFKDNFSEVLIGVTEGLKVIE